MLKKWKCRFKNDYQQYKIVGKTYEYWHNTFITTTGAGQVTMVFQT